MRSLIHLPCLRYDDATSMRKFYDEVIGHVRSVESMGGKFNSETLAPVLVPLIVDKLPKEVVEKWELELNEEKAKQDRVEVKTLFTFLEQLIRAKESSQPPSLDSKAPAKENPGNHENRFKCNRSQKSSTSALCATTQEAKCVICYKNYGLRSCVNFLSLPLKETFRKATCSNVKACVSDALNLVIELKCARNLHASIVKVDVTVSCIKIQLVLTWKKSRWNRSLNYHPRRHALLYHLQSWQILLQ